MTVPLVVGNWKMNGSQASILGLIDMGNAAGLDAAPPAAPAPPATFRTLEDAERWKRGVILRARARSGEGRPARRA